MDSERTIVGYSASFTFLDGFVLGLGFWLDATLVAGIAWSVWSLA
jgi:hypothetical protein